jgi:shikimate kinase
LTGSLPQASRLGWAGLHFLKASRFSSLRERLVSSLGSDRAPLGHPLGIPSASAEALAGIWRDCGLEALVLAPGLAAGLAGLLRLPFSGGAGDAALLARSESGEHLVSLGASLVPAAASARPEPEAARKPNRITFIGPMASGKSSVGRAFAALSGLPFFDSDAEVEAEAGASIPELFAAEGEPGFRARESRALARLLSGPPAVVATGGGAVLPPENRRLIAASGEVVWLHAPAPVLASRAGSGEGRPLLAGADPAAALAAIYRERLPLYRSIADWLVPADGPEPRRIAEVIHDEIEFSR